MGLGRAQQQAFLRMQYEIQRRAYALQFPGLESWVVSHSGVTVGRLLVWAEAAELRLVDITILPDLRNGGIGTSLLEGLKARGAERKQPLRLQVHRANRAITLYERLGFQVTGASETHWAMEWREGNSDDA